MGIQSTVILPEAIKSIDTSTFTGAYQAVGTPTTHEGRIVKFANSSNVKVTVSWDGATDHDVYPAGTKDTYEIGTNRGSPSPVFVVQKGTQFFAKGAAGVGTFDIVVLYGNTPTATIPL